MQIEFTPATIIVKPDPSYGWLIVTPRLHSQIRLNGRQRAIQFARAYANLQRPVLLQVLDEAGHVEVEEFFEDHLRNGTAAEPPKLVALPSRP